MTHEAFQFGLRDTGGYATPAEARGAAASCPVATCRYHAGVTAIVIGGGLEAWRGRFDASLWSRRGFGILRLIERLGGTVSFEGFAPRAAHAGPVVYAANHMSAIETLVLPAGLLAFGRVSVVLKASLLRYPVFGAVTRRIDPIVVARRNARDDLRAVLHQGCARLGAGTSVLLFPQATRAAVFRPSQFNSLAAKLAQAAGVPLVPVAVQSDFLGIGRLLRDVGPVHPARPVRFAAGPLLLPSLPPPDLRRQCVAFIAGRLTAWGLPVEHERESVP